MVVSLDNIPKGSQVLRFITSGQRGRCKICSKLVEKLEAHHLCYSPEITIKLCHNCHHKVHFWPQRLSDGEKTILLLTRFSPAQTQEIIIKKMIGMAALSKLIAPSRNAFIHASQRIQKKKLGTNKINKNRYQQKSSHSRGIIKINKGKALNLIKKK
ncbi:hypothetical protein ES703_117717 [subsurface metagenome]